MSKDKWNPIFGLELDLRNFFFLWQIENKGGVKTCSRSNMKVRREITVFTFNVDSRKLIFLFCYLQWVLYKFILAVRTLWFTYIAITFFWDRNLLLVWRGLAISTIDPHFHIISVFPFLMLPSSLSLVFILYTVVYICVWFYIHTYLNMCICADSAFERRTLKKWVALRILWRLP